MTIKTEPTIERIPLGDICPKCGRRLSLVIQEHIRLRVCTNDSYQAKDIDGESKLRYAEAVGRFGLGRR